MINESTLYWVTRLDNILVFCGISLPLCLVFLLFAFFCFIGVTDEDNKAFAKRLLIFNLILSGLLVPLDIATLVFLPTTKEMVVIKVLPKIVNSDFTQKDLPAEAKELYVLAKQALDQYVNKGEKK